jgi:hypothetical protein
LRHRDPKISQSRFVADELRDLNDKRTKAVFQVKLKTFLDALQKMLKGRPDLSLSSFNKSEAEKLGYLIEDLEATLMEYSDMVNKITLPYHLWEQTLEIIRECRYETFHSCSFPHIF